MFDRFVTGLCQIGVEEMVFHSGHIFDGNAKKKIAITRKFIQNIKLREKLKF